MPFHINSPLVESPALSKHMGVPVFLKLDSLQPSGSFKIRGLGIASERAKENGAKGLVCASGGNAGMAVAYAARMMNLPATIVVPESSPTMMKGKLEEENAEVIIHGINFSEAEVKAKEIEAVTGAKYIPPFDSEDIWEGNSTLVDEIAEKSAMFPGGKPGLIVTVCGGGGLFCGLSQGLQRHNWGDVPILVVETEGAHSFHETFKNGKLTYLKEITSIAKTLGALCICKEAFDWTKKRPVESVVVTDKMAVDACYKFANDHRILIEPSCGAGLAALYTKNAVFEKLKPTSIAVIVCGGNMVSLEMLESWKKTFDL